MLSGSLGEDQVKQHFGSFSTCLPIDVLNELKKFRSRDEGYPAAGTLGSTWGARGSASAAASARTRSDGNQVRQAKRNANENARKSKERRTCGILFWDLRREVMSGPSSGDSMSQRKALREKPVRCGACSVGDRYRTAAMSTSSTGVIARGALPVEFDPPMFL